MFLFGLACGVVLAAVFIWAVIELAPPEKPAPTSPKQSIHDIERQAIREMVATAMVNGRAGAKPAETLPSTPKGADEQ